MWRVILVRGGITAAAGFGAAVLAALGFNELAEAVHRLGELAVSVAP
jgi:hypothetical protein